MKDLLNYIYLICQNITMTMFRSILNFVLNDLVIDVFVFLIIFSFLLLIICIIFRKNKIEGLKSFIVFLITVTVFLLALKAYKNVDTWLLYQISERCIVKNIKIEERERRVYPTFINQGGDAIAYNDLVRRHYKSKNNPELRKFINEQLLRIYSNHESVDKYFNNYFSINRVLPKPNWNHQNPTPNSCQIPSAHKDSNCYEKFGDFEMPNVIDQLNHPTFWTTRATCAKYLQNTDYLKGIKDSKDKMNLTRMKEYGIENMFKNLVDRIEKDHSLIVKKISLDTYKLWACFDNKDTTKIDEKKTCESIFISENVYNFNKVKDHWEKNKPEILLNFKQSLGLLD